MRDHHGHMVDISVSSTTKSDDGGYTLYNVTVNLNGKHTNLRKRYSDFALLKEELEGLYGTTLPFPFPRKTLFRSTVNNESLTEERRVMFESLLRQILSDEDSKWRKALPFKEFLNLPPGTFSTANESMLEKANDAFELVANSGPITDLREWLEIIRDSKKKLTEAKAQLYKAPTETRKLLVLTRSRFDRLSNGLEAISDQGLIGDGEMKRRRELLNSLKREHRDLEQLLSSASSTSGAHQNVLSQQRSQLLKGSRVIGQPQETARTRGLDDGELLQLQKQDFREQDQELELLSSAIRRQKELGLAINEELAIQNELLDELDTEVESSAAKLHYAEKRVGKFT